MASLLSSVTATTSDANRKRKSSPEFPSSDPIEPSSDGSFFDPGRKRFNIEDEDLWAAEKKPRISDVTLMPDENSREMEVDEVVVKNEPRDMDDDGLEIKVRDTKPLVTSTRVNGGPRRKVVNSSSVKHVLKTEPEPEIKPRATPNAMAIPGAAHWSSVQESLVPQAKVSELDEVKVSVGLVKADNVLESDGSLRIFWLDYMEQEGVVHLVGKILDRQSGKYVSACVSINGIQRNLFVKPRAKRFCKFGPRWHR